MPRGVPHINKAESKDSHWEWNKEIWQRVLSPHQPQHMKSCFCGCNWLTKHWQKVPNEPVQEQKGIYMCPWKANCSFLGSYSGSEISGQTSVRFPLSRAKTEVCFWPLTVTLPCSCPPCKASAAPAYNLRSAHVLLEGNVSSSAGEAKAGIARTA